MSSLTVRVELPLLEADRLFAAISAAIAPILERAGGGEIQCDHSDFTDVKQSQPSVREAA